MRSRTMTTAASSAALAATLVLAGCSSTSGKKAEASKTAATQTAADRLAAAKKELDTTPGYHFKLQGTDVPKDTSGVLSGEGDVNNKPAFKGTLNVQAGSLAASVPIVALGGKTYAKLPFAAKMTQIQPNTYGAPDPNKLFSKDQGLSTLLPQTQSAKLGGQLRDGKDIVTSISGTLPGSVIKSVLYMGDGSGTFTVKYNLTDANELRSATVVGPFYKGGTSSTYDLDFTDFGKTVDVQAP